MFEAFVAAAVTVIISAIAYEIYKKNEVESTPQEDDDTMTNPRFRDVIAETDREVEERRKRRAEAEERAKTPQLVIVQDSRSTLQHFANGFFVLIFFIVGLLASASTTTGGGETAAIVAMGSFIIVAILTRR